MFKVFMPRDLFFYYTCKMCGDTGDNRLTVGQWQVLNLPEGGGMVLCAILKVKKLPHREVPGSVISLADVTQLAYNMSKCLCRMRGTLCVEIAQ